MAKRNICIIGLYDIKVKQLAQKLSNTLDMYFADIDELIAFDLLDVQLTQEVCGREYMLKIEKNKVKQVVTYENTLLTLNYSILNNESNIDVLRSNCVVVYFKFSLGFVKDKFIRKKDKLDLELYEDRDYICTKMADIVIRCDEINNNAIINETISKINDFYK